MIARVMDGFYEAEIRNFTVVVGEDGGSVVEWLTTEWHHDVQLRFAPQGHHRGTASALAAARALIDGPFIITSCDAIVPQEHIVQMLFYFDTHPSDAAVLSLLVSPDEASATAGVLLDPRGNVAFISEQGFGAHQDFLTTLPVYGFRPEVLNYLDRVPVEGDSGERVLSAAIQSMIDDQELVGSIQAEWLVKLETPEDLMAENLRRLATLEESVIESKLPADVEITEPVYIEGGVGIASGSQIGPNAYLERGTITGGSVTIRDAVILGANVEAGAAIEHQLLAEEPQ
jgi:NDP-sugar pyrophosphorylase family protein